MSKMKFLEQHACVIGFAMMLVVAGCSQNISPPPTITIESLPAALQKAFAKSPPAAKTLVSEIADNLKTPDYTLAYNKLQTLSGLSNLSREQSQIAAGGLLAVNKVLQEAGSKGDASAVKTLNDYRVNK
jgi:hypothetical protein